MNETTPEPDAAPSPLQQLQALLLLEAAERVAELDRIRQDDPTRSAFLEELLAYDAAAQADGFLASEPARADAPETMIGPYQVDRIIGRGGMGTVYLAHRQEPYRQAVAIKKIRPGLSESLTARFQAERQILATLDHPGIVRLLDGGTDTDGSPYLVMDYVAGPRLDKHCQERNLPRDERVRLVHAVAEALAYAHKRGIIHRDLKPSNVLMGEDDRPRVTDFGLAKLIAGAGVEDGTETDLLLGTPPYMAPERLSFGPGRNEPGVDVYALGVILFTLLAGRLPFEPEDPLGISQKALQEDAPPLRRLAPSIPRDLETIVSRSLARDPGDRFTDAGELAEQLRRYLAGVPLSIHPPTNRDRLIRWIARRRGPVVAWAGSFAVVLLVMVALLAVWNRELQRDRDALRATTRSIWSTSAELFEVIPPVEPAIRQFYEEMARSFETIRERGLIEPDPSLDRQFAVMLRQLATALPPSRKLDEALPLLDRSIALLRPLPPRVSDPVVRAWTEFDLFRALSVRASLLISLERPADALVDSDQALLIIGGLVDRFPSDPAWIEAQARHMCTQAVIMGRLGRPAEERGLNLRALGLARHSVELAGAEVDSVKLNTLNHLLIQHADTSPDPDEQERFYREAVEVAHRPISSRADVWSRRIAQISSLERLGQLLVTTDRPSEALPYFTEALRLHDGLPAIPTENLPKEIDRRSLSEALARCREMLHDREKG